MIPDSYVIYSSLQAAADMFQAAQLVHIRFSDTHYIDGETAAANLDIARMRQALDAKA